jgi:DNA polymerase IV
MRRPASVECLYVDFDSFFATAEQHLQPHLRGRPVGVIPLDTPHTGLIAASREAKQVGIKRGTWARDAKKLCPDIVLVAARHDQYVRLHRRIAEIVEDIVPIHAVRSIDEMVCMLLSNEQAQALDIARGVKAALARELGSVLTCSIGLGPNELLAKIAAEMQKPDGLAVIRPEDLPGPLLALDLTDIPGIARGNAARLARAGVADMAQFWALAPKQARAIWGNVEGERLWAALHGYVVERPETGRVMFGHGRVLPRDWRTPARVYACARFLVVKAARRMRREGFAARGLALWFTDRTSAGWFGEDRFAPIWDDRSILASLRRLFRSARAGEAPLHSRSVHVALHDLVPLGALTRDLFDFMPESETRRRWERLSLLSDSLAARFGRAVLHCGPSVEPPGGYVGAKIAFGRIPDERDF